MPRVISVFLPTLSTDRVRRKAGDTAPLPETPLILEGRVEDGGSSWRPTRQPMPLASASACPQARPRRWCGA
jgi:hypothetical protein